MASYNHCNEIGATDKCSDATEQIIASTNEVDKKIQSIVLTKDDPWGR